MTNELRLFIKDRLKKQYEEILNNLGCGRIGGKDNYEKITGILECLKCTYETNIDVLVDEFEKLTVNKG